jgi:Uma2 family endonuclease
MRRSQVHDHGGFGPYTIEDLHARADDGKGLELEDGWLVESSPSAPHQWAVDALRDLLKAATLEAGAAVLVAGGGEWEISTPVGIRKPDVFLVPKDVARASVVHRNPITIPGGEALLAVEVISPGSSSERTDRVRKPGEYAALGIPQYWIAEYTPDPLVQVMVLDDGRAAYRLDSVTKKGSVFEATVQADVPIEVSFDHGGHDRLLTARGLAEAGELGGDLVEGPARVQAAGVGEDPQSGRAERAVLGADLRGAVAEGGAVGGHARDGEVRGPVPLHQGLQAQAALA